jgi:hypothetical protein
MPEKAVGARVRRGCPCATNEAKLKCREAVLKPAGSDLADLSAPQLVCEVVIADLLDGGGIRRYALIGFSASMQVGGHFEVTLECGLWFGPGAEEADLAVDLLAPLAVVMSSMRKCVIRFGRLASEPLPGQNGYRGDIPRDSPDNGSS